MENNLTLKVKELAYRLGADLVGIANIERYKDAPIRMSPQGILPSAKSVIVCAVHHPDAAIELDGEIHPYHVRHKRRGIYAAFLRHIRMNSLQNNTALAQISNLMIVRDDNC